MATSACSSHADAPRRARHRHRSRYRLLGQARPLRLSRSQIFDGPKPSLVLARSPKSRVPPTQRGDVAQGSRLVLSATQCRLARQHRAYWGATQSQDGFAPLLLVSGAEPGPHLLLHSVALSPASLVHTSYQAHDSAGSTHELRSGADNEPALRSDQDVGWASSLHPVPLCPGSRPPVWPPLLQGLHGS